MLDACVGCMTCVNACPDTAILGVAQPESVVDEAIGAFAAGEPDPARAEATARTHFAHTTKYADVPARRGLEPALFGIFVDPIHCKGCAECVEVCHALGYDALRDGRQGPASRRAARAPSSATRATCASCARCRRRRRSTATRRRSRT